VRHDENMNGKLDKNFVGIPKEGYGASLHSTRQSSLWTPSKLLK
jgi:uncharacterized protein (DUF2141 family)